MTLISLKRGQKALVTGIDHPNLKIEALRFGIGVGQVLECVEMMPFGPIIVKKRNMEIAIGRELANVIQIEKQ